MFERFHDEEYDGLIVKLPNWFIKLNGLESVINDFKEGIKTKSTTSLFHPDFCNSIKELDEYPLKSEFFKEKKKREEESKKNHMKWVDDRLKRKVLDISWVDDRLYPYNESISLNENEVYYIDDFFTKGKKTENKKLLSSINQKINSFNKEEMSKFLNLNKLDVREYELEKHIKIPENPLYIDNRLNLTLKLSYIGVNVYINENTYLKGVRFFYSQKDNDFIANIHRKNSKDIHFSDYEVKDNFLIKKEIIE